MAAADEEAIHTATEALREAVNRGDTDGVLSVWADDGVLMPPGHPAVIGKHALEEYFRHLFARSRFHFVFTASHVLIDAASGARGRSAIDD